MAPAPKRVAIVQSNYIPWKGYFDLIGLVDEFVLYDEVQYTSNDWRNRNRIKTDAGCQWLTIPVARSGRFGQRIDEAEVVDSRWRTKHWRALSQSYGSAPFFSSYANVLGELYLGSTETRLSPINRAFIEAICSMLGFQTRLRWSTEIGGDGDRIARLVGLCTALDADVYLSGPAAKSYLDETAFRAAGIDVEYMSYDGYARYPQRGDSFEHGVTVLDLLFAVGPDAKSYMKVGSRERSFIG